MIREENKYEAENQTGQNYSGADANDPVRRLTATSIMKDDVENAEGESLGTIKDLMININSGSIEYAVLKYGGVLGIGGKLFAIPWSEFKIDPLREVFVINRSKEYMENAPGFDEDHWPETNNHYFQEAYTYWGAPIDGVHSPAQGFRF